MSYEKDMLIEAVSIIKELINHPVFDSKSSEDDYTLGRACDFLEELEQ